MWYNLTTMKNNTTSKEYFIPYQLKMPLEISVLIDMDDPIYSFNEIMNHIDLNSYVAEKKSMYVKTAAVALSENNVQKDAGTGRYA